MWQTIFKDELSKTADIGFASKRLLVGLRNMKKVGPMGGALVGGVAGAIGAPGPDASTGEATSPMPSILTGAALGAVGGAVAKKGLNTLRASSNMKTFGGGLGRQVSKNINPALTGSQTLGNPAMLQKLQGPAAGAAPAIGEAAAKGPGMGSRIMGMFKRKEPGYNWSAAQSSLSKPMSEIRAPEPGFNVVKTKKGKIIK
jgi:hypothetical protein